MGKYAEAEDLAAFLHVETNGLPSDYERLIDRAEDVIDFYTSNQGTLNPTNSFFGPSSSTDLEQLQAEARTKATCAQVEFYINQGEDVEFEGAVSSKTWGKTSVTYAGNGMPELAPRARMALMQARLLGAGAYVR